MYWGVSMCPGSASFTKMKTANKSLPSSQVPTTLCGADTQATSESSVSLDKVSEIPTPLWKSDSSSSLMLLA